MFPQQNFCLYLYVSYNTAVPGEHMHTRVHSTWGLNWCTYGRQSHLYYSTMDGKYGIIQKLMQYCDRFIKFSKGCKFVKLQWTCGFAICR